MLLTYCLLNPSVFFILQSSYKRNTSKAKKSSRLIPTVAGTLWLNTFALVVSFLFAYYFWKLKTTPNASSPSYPLRSNGRNGPQEAVARQQSRCHGVAQLHAKRNWPSLVIVVYVPICFDQRHGKALLQKWSLKVWPWFRTVVIAKIYVKSVVFKVWSI